MCYHGQTFRDAGIPMHNISLNAWCYIQLQRSVIHNASLHATANNYQCVHNQSRCCYCFHFFMIHFLSQESRLWNQTFSIIISSLRCPLISLTALCFCFLVLICVYIENLFHVEFYPHNLLWKFSCQAQVNQNFRLPITQSHSFYIYI